MKWRICRSGMAIWAVVAGLLLALGPAAVQAQGGGWEWQNPLPQGNWLHAVWGSSGSDVFAVGDAGTILHYDGAAWSPMDSGTTESLYGVWGSSGSHVFAVGYGTILHYNGMDWSPMSSGTGNLLYGVWGSSGSDAFAVGDCGTILHYSGGSQAAPVAMDDSYTTTEDIPLVVADPGVLANDSDPNGDPLAAMLDTPPVSGTLVLNLDGSFTYTPTLGFTGVDTFTYHATDTISDSNLALVTLTVQTRPLHFVYLPLVLKSH